MINIKLIEALLESTKCFCFYNDEAEALIKEYCKNGYSISRAFKNVETFGKKNINQYNYIWIIKEKLNHSQMILKIMDENEYKKFEKEFFTI